MKMRSEQGGLIVLHLDRGEAVRAALEGLARDEDLRGARVHAIGALEDPEIGYYDLDARSYRTKVLEGRYDLVSPARRESPRRAVFGIPSPTRASHPTFERLFFVLGEWRGGGAWSPREERWAP